MRLRYNMQDIWISNPSKPNGPKINILVSDDFLTNEGRCLVLLQGKGEAKMGIWARSVCINDNLRQGSMLPMLEFAKATGQSVLVFNPNMETDPYSGEKMPYCANMDEHCKYVWENYLMKKCKAQSLAMVVHSAGGRCTATLVKAYKQQFLERVKCLVFTDAYYHTMFQSLNQH